MGEKRLSEMAADAEQWLNENRTKFEALGESGVEIFVGLRKMFTNRAVVTAQNVSGYDDVDEILFDAQKIDDAMKSKNIDLPALLDVVQVAVKFAVSAAALLGV